MILIVSFTPLVLLAILSVFTVLGKVSYGHGLGDIIYRPIPFILFITQACFIYFITSNLAIILFSIFILFLSIVTLIKMTVRRGPEDSWQGPVIPFIKSTSEPMDKQMLKEFDRLIAKAPNDEALKREKKLFLKSLENLKQ